MPDHCEALVRGSVSHIMGLLQKLSSPNIIMALTTPAN
jgi:hypothetical protein